MVWSQVSFSSLLSTLKLVFCLSPNCHILFSGCCCIFFPLIETTWVTRPCVFPLILCFIMRHKTCQPCIPSQAMLIGVTGVYAILNVLLGLHSFSSGVKIRFQLGHEVASCWYVCGVEPIFKTSVVCQVALLYF